MQNAVELTFKFHWGDKIFVPLMKNTLKCGLCQHHSYCFGYTRWFKYDQYFLCVNCKQSVPVIFETPCTNEVNDFGSACCISIFFFVYFMGHYGGKKLEKYFNFCGIAGPLVFYSNNFLSYEDCRGH